IEDKSMEIIEASLGNSDIAPEERPIIKRAIHTTGDFEFLHSMVFYKGAVAAGLKALREGCTIFTDVTMVQSGINKRFGHDVKCVLNEEAVISGAERNGMTKAAFGIQSLGTEMDGAIVAIGNAPTALIKLVDMVKAGEVKPALIVGIPVGFVNAKEAKHYLATLPASTGTPYITNKGHKGGSTVAAAIVNALIKMEFQEDTKDKREAAV
ncbi:MAG: precorrin-8X methylmutase, partial [Deltaproteobacteria bacterium]|nr:precorrin-8X methylmutase [Deltaproteobacteria bacterium]